MAAQSYPLQWPDHIPRSTRREGSRFRTSYEQALKNVVTSLRAFGADSSKPITSSVMSSNMDLLNHKPSDPGVAVWFVWDNISICIPVDRYLTPAENLQAIHHIIEARRTELRHGTLHLVRATFQGFKALPPPPGAERKRPYWEVLGIPQGSSAQQFEVAYMAKAKQLHPDAGGTTEAMAELNRAREEARH